MNFCPWLRGEIGYKYSLKTLLNLRPRWVLLCRDAHYLTCLCDRCVNVQLILNCLSGFVKRIKLYGSPMDIAALQSFDLHQFRISFQKYSILSLKIKTGTNLIVIFKYVSLLMNLHVEVNHCGITFNR